MGIHAPHARLGPANSAKAGEVLGGFAAAAQRGAILVVPTAVDADHFSRELADDGAVLGSVLTFNGLASEIADRAGYAARRLTPLQRERVLAKALGATQFDALRAAAATAGFPQAAGELIAELQRSLITPQRFAGAMEPGRPRTRAGDRMPRDVAAIYSAYAAELERLGPGRPELYAWRALDALRAAPGRWGPSRVFFYGFDDLHPLERDAIETLARVVGAEVTVSLTYEAGRAALTARAEAVEELRPSGRPRARLPASAEHYDPESRDALHHLERELFEPGPERVDPGTAIQLLEAGGELAEAELAAAEVLSTDPVRRARGRDRRRVPLAGACGDARRARVRQLRDPGGDRPARARSTAPRSVARCSALARFALTNDTEAGAEDLIEYLRGPGWPTAPTPSTDWSPLVRRRGLRTAAEARQRPDFELPEIDALRAAEDPAAELLATPGGCWPLRTGSSPRARRRGGARRTRGRHPDPRPGRARRARRAADRSQRADRAARDARAAGGRRRPGRARCC